MDTDEQLTQMLLAELEASEEYQRSTLLALVLSWDDIAELYRRPGDT